mmetsp:Transcript_39845/g.104331  ORF Transcript_39845/g.104331 Transcript_39845/m.104331 type:complete len:242 (-) Transcript_39845:1274-1999(-)
MTVSCSKFLSSCDTLRLRGRSPSFNFCSRSAHLSFSSSNWISKSTTLSDSFLFTSLSSDSPAPGSPGLPRESTCAWRFSTFCVSATFSCSHCLTTFRNCSGSLAMTSPSATPRVRRLRLRSPSPDSMEIADCRLFCSILLVMSRFSSCRCLIASLCWVTSASSISCCARSFSISALLSALSSANWSRSLAVSAIIFTSFCCSSFMLAFSFLSSCTSWFSLLTSSAFSRSSTFLRSRSSSRS